MASHPHPSEASLALLLAALPSLPRPVLSRLTARLIDRLDDLDGDPDLEANGDELDGTAGEDDFYPHHRDHGWNPGCPISDPGGGDVEDEGEPESGVLWPAYGIDQTRPLGAGHQP